MSPGARLFTARRLDALPEDMTPSARLLLVALWLHEVQHGHGMTRSALSAWSGTAKNTFTRSWGELLRRGLLVRS